MLLTFKFAVQRKKVMKHVKRIERRFHGFKASDNKNDNGVISDTCDEPTCARLCRQSGGNGYRRLFQRENIQRQ